MASRGTPLSTIRRRSVAAGRSAPHPRPGVVPLNRASATSSPSRRSPGRAGRAGQPSPRRPVPRPAYARRAGHLVRHFEDHELVCLGDKAALTPELIELGSDRHHGVGGGLVGRVSSSGPSTRSCPWRRFTSLRATRSSRSCRGPASCLSGSEPRREVSHSTESGSSGVSTAHAPPPGPPQGPSPDPIGGRETEVRPGHLPMLTDRRAEPPPSFRDLGAK